MKRFIVVVILALLCSSAAAAQTVTKLTTTAGVVVNPATSDNQTNGNQTTQIKSSAGTEALVGNWASSLGTTQTGLNVRALGYLYNGSQVERAPGDGTNGADVDVTRIATSNGKTILYTSISQTVAGTTTIAAASASNKHKIVGVTLSMDAAGTLKFSDSSGDLTGALPLAANTPYTLPTSNIPYFMTGAVNRLVSLTTTTGKAFGVVQYITEP